MDTRFIAGNTLLVKTEDFISRSIIVTSLRAAIYSLFLLCHLLFHIYRPAGNRDIYESSGTCYRTSTKKINKKGQRRVVHKGFVGCLSVLAKPVWRHGDINIKRKFVT